MTDGNAHAAYWTPPAWTDDGAGSVRPELVWGALDCPGTFAILDGGLPDGCFPALGCITATTLAPIAVGEPVMVLAWLLDNDGRRWHAATAIVDREWSTACRRIADVHRRAGLVRLEHTMSTLQIGYLPARIGHPDPAMWLRAISLADEAGIDHVATGDHVSFGGMGVDGLVGAANVLGRSDRMVASTAVYLLPLRHPVTVARQVADLAALAPGRLLFGVGLGGEDPHELEICGVDPRTRGRRMDESLAVVRALLSGKPVDFAGEHFALAGARIEPTLRVPVPIVVGGRSEAAIRRAGRLGDGWFGIWVSPERYRVAIDLMQSTADEAGRGELTWTNALNVWCGVGRDPEAARRHVAAVMERLYGMPYERFAKWSPAGTPADIAAFVAPYADAGCSLVHLIVCGESVEAEVEAVAEVRRLLTPQTVN